MLLGLLSVGAGCGRVVASRLIRVPAPKLRTPRLLRGFGLRVVCMEGRRVTVHRKIQLQTRFVGCTESRW